MQTEKQRERLVELLNEATFGVNKHTLADHLHKETIERVADYLIANNVVVLPCVVGQTVWCIYNYEKPKEFQVAVLSMSENHYSFTIEANKGVFKHYCDKDAVGKYVFFTKEEAENVLKERNNAD
jgi:hypothetical protein